VKIFTPLISELELEPGQILIQDKKLFVGTATFALEIDGVQPSGKAAMAASSWVNGVRLATGERFG
jgi:methionyl-tRNA formyltransferase